MCIAAYVISLKPIANFSLLNRRFFSPPFVFEVNARRLGDSIFNLSPRQYLSLLVTVVLEAAMPVNKERSYAFAAHTKRHIRGDSRANVSAFAFPSRARLDFAYIARPSRARPST